MGPQKGNDFPGHRIPAKPGLRTVPSAQTGHFRDAGSKGTQMLGSCHLGLRVKLCYSDSAGGSVWPLACQVCWFSVGHWHSEMCHCPQSGPSKLVGLVGGWGLKAGTWGGGALSGTSPRTPTTTTTEEGEGAEGAHRGCLRRWASS